MMHVRARISLNDGTRDCDWTKLLISNELDEQEEWEGR